MRCSTNNYHLISAIWHKSSHKEWDELASNNIQLDGSGSLLLTELKNYTSAKKEGRNVVLLAAMVAGHGYTT